MLFIGQAVGFLASAGAMYYIVDRWGLVGSSSELCRSRGDADALIAGENHRGGSSLASVRLCSAHSCLPLPSVSGAICSCGIRNGNPGFNG